MKYFTKLAVSSNRFDVPPTQLFKPKLIDAVSGVGKKKKKTAGEQVSDVLKYINRTSVIK